MKMTVKQKSAFKVAFETFKEFAENTGIHGLKCTVDDQVSKVEKAIWAIAVILGICGAGYMTVLFWDRYTSNPTRTSIATNFAPISSIPFPAVTICNVNRIMGSKIEQLVDNLQLEDEEERTFVRGALPQLMAYISAHSVNYSGAELRRLQRLLDGNGLGDPAQVMMRLAQGCGELVVKCAWGIAGDDCKAQFRQSVTAEGHCCTFNSYVVSKTGQAKTTSYSGPHTGLSLILDPMFEDVQYSSIHASGLKVYVHNFDMYPDIDTFTKIVSMGRVTDLQVLAHRLVCGPTVRQLAAAQRRCLYPSERRLRYFSEYHYANCLSECKIRAFASSCGCVPFYFQFTDKEICNISQIPCLDQTKMSKKYNNAVGCVCPSQCEETFYEIISTTSKLVNMPDLVTNNFLAGEFRKLHRDSIVLQIYFASETHSILLRDSITSTTYLLSSFGGVYSLFMGCSIITVVELIYFIFMRFFIKLKLLPRVDSMTRQEQNVQRRVAKTPTIRLNNIRTTKKPNMEMLYNEEVDVNTSLQQNFLH